MTHEEELATQIKRYQDLKKTDPNVDIASLALYSLQSAEANHLSAKEKRWAYLISLGFPPFGLLFALKFFFSDKDDGRKAAYVCMGLTAAAVILFIVITNLMFASTGLSVDQLKSAPQQYQELLQ